MPAFSDGYVSVGGLRLHYVDYGGQGETLLALPGLIQTARAFDSIAGLLVPHVRLVAMDFRGRGGSEWGPPERYRVDQYLRDLMGLLAELRVERVSLIGTSLGGLIARLYATAHPDRVIRLVLNDFAIGGDSAGFHHVSARPSNAPAEFASLTEAANWFLSGRHGLGRLDRETLHTWVGHYLEPSGNGALRLRCDPAVIRLAASFANHLMVLKRSTVETDLAWEQAKRLTMPVLLLRGALSEVIPQEAVRRLSEVIPTARSVEIPGVGHSPTLYEPEAQEALLEFFGISVATLAAS